MLSHLKNIYPQDGKVLCKIIGKLSQDFGPISNQMIDVTGKISHLEEKNIKLFLESVKKETKISDLFGREKEKALKNFGNFQRVLVGLAKLSRHFNKEIESFEIKNEKSILLSSQIQTIKGYKFKSMLIQNTKRVNFN